MKKQRIFYRFKSATVDGIAFTFWVSKLCWRHRLPASPQEILEGHSRSRWLCLLECIYSVLTVLHGQTRTVARGTEMGGVHNSGISGILMSLWVNSGAFEANSELRQWARKRIAVHGMLIDNCHIFSFSLKPGNFAQKANPALKKTHRKYQHNHFCEWIKTGKGLTD